MISKSDLSRQNQDFNNDSERWQFVSSLKTLGLWMLRPEFLEQACRGLQAQSCPTDIEKIKSFLVNPQSFLECNKGACYILFANKIHSDIFRESFALPLIWKQNNNQHDPRLPSPLQQLAQKIVQDLQIELPESISWSLHLNLENSCDIAALEDTMECHSGWATLTASLILAIKGGTPNPHIWASGAWNNEHGIEKIGSLPQKMATVEFFQGQKLFIPQGNNEEAQQHAKDLDICTFTNGDTKVTSVLREYLSLLDIPPDRGTHLENRINYYNRAVSRDSKRAAEYYQQNLQEDLARACWQRSVTELQLQTIDNLVTFIGMNTGYRFVLFAVKPKNVLLFYTKETKDEYLEIKHKLEKENQTQIQEELYQGTNDIQEDQEVRRKIQQFVQKHHETTTALDVTPGPKDFTIQAMWALDSEINPFLYLCHDYCSKNRSYLPGEEKIRRLQQQV